MIDLKDGFYWAKPKEYVSECYAVDFVEVVSVESDKVFISGFDETFYCEDFDFGVSPAPIGQPEWVLG